MRLPFCTFLVLTEFLCRSFFVIDPFLMSPPSISVAATAPPVRDETSATRATTIAGLGRRDSRFRFMEVLWVGECASRARVLPHVYGICPAPATTRAD